MRLLLVGWDSQVRSLAHIAAKLIDYGNEVYLVVDQKSLLDASVLIGFNPDIVLISIPSENAENKVSSLAIQAKERNIPYTFYTRSLHGLVQSDICKNCKAIFIPYEGQKYAKSYNDGPAIITVNNEVEIIKHLRELA